MTYNEWAARHPMASAELNQILNAVSHPMQCDDGDGDGDAESDAQQQARLNVASAGALSWRNNVGATPAKCKKCGAPSQPVRFGLANDSAKLNKQIKSADLILAIPRVITPQMVGTTIAQFGSVEVKRPGWHYTGKGREEAQAAWATLINRIGGYAIFSTGDVQL